jgi:hypothetical protein
MRSLCNIIWNGLYISNDGMRRHRFVVFNGVIRWTSNERNRGWPNLTWDESMKRDLKDWCIIKELALDRREWKLAIHVSEYWSPDPSILLLFIKKIPPFLSYCFIAFFSFFGLVFFIEITLRFPSLFYLVFFSYGFICSLPNLLGLKDLDWYCCCCKFLMDHELDGHT